jgi:membrane protease YdiL (CAAX protease family)
MLFIDGRLRPIWRIFVYIFVVAIPAEILPRFWDRSEPELIQAGLVIALSLVLVVAVDRRSAGSLGLRIDRRGLMDLLVGITIPAVQLGLILMIELALGWTRVLGSAWNWRILAYGLGLWTVVAVHEELQTRGYVFQSLLTLGGRRFGPVLALGATSFVFGGLHGSNPNVTLRGIIILIVVGLEFGIAYLVTRRLWLPIGMHFSWNLFEGTLLGYPVSGQSSPSFLTLERGGPASWTGGDFGPEGGWLVLFVSVLDIGFLLGLAAIGFWRPDPFPHEAEQPGRPASPCQPLPGPAL